MWWRAAFSKVSGQSYIVAVVLIAIVLVILNWLLLRYGLNYDPFQGGDVSDYWEDSLNWRTPYNPFHMPGYPLVIAAVRGITSSVLQPQGIMLATTLASFSVAVAAVYRMGQSGHGSDKRWLGIMAVTLFVLWPLVGTNYVAYPIADMFGMAPLLLGWLLLTQKRPFPAAIMLGLAMVSHKGMWPFAVLLMSGHAISARTVMSLLVAGVMIVPAAILWTLGAFHHDSVTWLFSSNIGFEVHSTSSLPLLDGVLGSILFGGLSGIAKGLLVFGLAVIALAVIKRCWALPRDHETKWYSIGIALAVLLLILVLNEREIWASVRFGRLLAVPLTILFGTMVIDAVKTRQAAIYGVSLAVLGLFLSQVAFGYYMTRIWTLSL